MAELRGPSGPISYSRDDLGYPSIESKTVEDASWARGWFHATDRLVQVQLTLAFAEGRAMELLGYNDFARYADTMTRLHRFTDDLDEQVGKLSAVTKQLCQRYCDGFNAAAKARGWPLILRAAGIKPRPYRLRDIVLMYRIVTWFGLNQLVEMAAVFTAELVAMKALPALGFLLGDAATSDELAAAPVAQWPEALSGFTGIPAVGMGGSNAVAIAGARSSTGGALLCADPHLEIARIPPVLHASHATHGNGAYAQGLHIPGILYPSFGRTESVSWAYTYGRVQSVDVRVVRCRRGEWFDGTSWRPLVKRTASIKVKKRPNETLTFWDSPIGTIVGDAHREAELALPCIVWSGARETYRELDTIPRMFQATSVDEVIALHREWKSMCFDAVVADKTGRIGHINTGRMDRRPAGSRGVLPRHPDGATLVPHDDATRPSTVDPASGWIVSANARANEPGAATWTPMGDTPARLQRLATLVAATEKAGLDDLMRIVLDASDACAERILTAWAPHMPDHPRAKALVEWARAQPGTGPQHFEHMTLWNLLHNEVVRSVLRTTLGSARSDRLVDGLQILQLFRHHIDEALALERLHHVDGKAIAAAIADAWPRALARSADPAVQLPRRDKFKNAVFAGALSWLMDTKPIENRGGPTTPNQVTATKIGDHTVVFGAAGRYLCDMSTPYGWYCLSGGASERRFGVGYGAGLEDWARGRCRPLGSPVGRAPRAT